MPQVRVSSSTPVKVRRSVERHGHMRDSSKIATRDSSKNAARRDSCTSGHRDRARAQGIATTKSRAEHRVPSHRDVFHPPSRLKTESPSGAAKTQKKPDGVSSADTNGSERNRDMDLNRTHCAKHQAPSAPTNLPVAGEMPVRRDDEWAPRTGRQQARTRRKDDANHRRVAIPSALQVAGHLEPRHVEHAHEVLPCVLPSEPAHECQPEAPSGPPANVPWHACLEDHTPCRANGGPSPGAADGCNAKVFDDYVDVVREAGGIPSALPPSGGIGTQHLEDHSCIVPCAAPYNANCRLGHEGNPEVEPYRYQNDNAAMHAPHKGNIPTAQMPAGARAKRHWDEDFPPECERADGAEADRVRAARDAQKVKADVDNVRLRSGILTNLPPGGHTTTQHVEHRYGIDACAVPNRAECNSGHAIAAEQDPTRFGIASALPVAGKWIPPHAEHTTGIAPCAVLHDANPCVITDNKPSFSLYISDPRASGDDETELPAAGRPQIVHRAQKQGIAPCVMKRGSSCAGVNKQYAGVPCYLRHLPPSPRATQKHTVRDKENIVGREHHRRQCGAGARKASRLPAAGIATGTGPHEIAQGVCPLAPGACSDGVQKRRHRHQKNHAPRSCNASTVSPKSGPPSTISSAIMDTVHGHVPLHKNDNTIRRTISPSGHHGQCKCKLCTCRRHACTDDHTLPARNARRNMVPTAHHRDGPFTQTTTHRTDFQQPALPNGGVTHEKVKCHDAPRRRLPNNITGGDGPINTRHTTQRIDYRWMDLPYDPARSVHARKSLPLLPDSEKYPLVTTTTHRSDFAKQPMQKPSRHNFSHQTFDTSHGDPGTNDTTYRADYVPKDQIRMECPVVAIERKCKAPCVPPGRNHIFYDRKTQGWY